MPQELVLLGLLGLRVVLALLEPRGLLVLLDLQAALALQAPRALLALLALHQLLLALLGLQALRVLQAPLAQQAQPAPTPSLSAPRLSPAVHLVMPCLTTRARWVTPIR